MKIDDKDVLSSSLQNIARTGADNASKRPVSSNGTGGASSNDAVHLTSNARLLSFGSTAGEDVRSARIEELRQLYLSGQYNVDSQDLSRSIIDAHLAGG